MAEHPNLVWITGATSGLGAALARNCPWPDAEIISISRRAHPDFATVHFDLTDMATWDGVGAHLQERLAEFRGQRALFIHNALYYWGRAFVGEGEHSDHRTEIIANVAAPLVLGDLFVRASQPAADAGVDCGLIQISSATARIVFPGLSIYGAAKASVEQWVRGVRKERERRGTGPWACAIRPGSINTPATRREALLPSDTHPGVPGIAEAVRAGTLLSEDDAAQSIWSAIPAEAKAKPVLLFGEAVGATE